MTRCDLLNISKIKQIVPRSQIWFYGSSVSQLVQSSYPRHKARHKGNQVGNQGYRFSYLASNPFIWSKTTVGYLYSSAQSKVRKSLSRASFYNKRLVHEPVFCYSCFEMP